MKGESRGDFSRDTFDPGKHFLRVLMQQGRVSLDADWNEQTDILLHYLQTLAMDLIGPYAGPEDESGFGITTANAPAKSFNISWGRYYVDGILCENLEETNYYAQLDFPREAKPDDFQSSYLPLLVYLDVWERHISYIEDDYIREKALGVADTASRSRVVWQVKALISGGQNDWKSILKGKITPSPSLCQRIRDRWKDIVENLLQRPHRGCLKAKAKEIADVPTDPCVISPESRYRGQENQLYRVEIHRGGLARNESNESQAAATFKWSRDNGTVAFPIISITGNIVVLEHLGRDDRLSLKKGDWVEVTDDDYTLLIQSRPSPLTEIRPLAQVDSVDTTEMSVTLRLQDGSGLVEDYLEGSLKHPLLRRWDHKKGDLTEVDEPVLAVDGALYVDEGKWLTLEDGVQIWFEKLDPPNIIQSYQRGDYWLVPARKATGDVEWPEDPDDPDGKLLLPPHGIDHHYAPLAVISRVNSSNEDWASEDCRCRINRALISP